MNSKSTFLKALRKEPSPYTPVWLLRQAGRYMPEYRKIRDRVSFLELCKTPDLASEVTVTAVKVLQADAAIIFADILLVAEPLGFNLRFEKKGGPKILNPFRDKRSLESLRARPDVASELGFVAQAIRICRKELRPEIPVIGFAGAPFTVASYLIEGGASKNFEATKSLMRSDPGLFKALMERISDATVVYLESQVKAGAEAIQLFDSWVGCLTPHEYLEHVQGFSRKILTALSKKVPTIHFGTQNASFLSEFAEAGGDAIGLDFRVELDQAWKTLGDVAVQGNLDPTVLCAPVPVIKAEASRILKQARGRPGHIFNVGHGLLPSTPVDRARALIDFVHETSSR